MFRRRSPERLSRELRSIDDAIEAHPFRSETITRAFAVIEDGDGDKELISARLREQGLPELQTIGASTLRYSLSWWWLHNRRRAAVRKIERHRG
ncbi:MULTISPECIES: hypothetical protein [unclassified Rathayibacter]|uniref:hypothetical protein n=1 Tax=unclassified Rathayibacter TaxID=2609250 RepID=UPI001FB3BCAB|nr:MULTISPECIES: hypothetical protein [unclassified Rathayibacter]MCJ1675048.1 hypothetical protein [Rathayibacter sp. VKM Ac-2929]MCJ1681834.1 hypothetical protein [Rathayibacter sp. VKM Ac-2928]